MDRRSSGDGFLEQVLLVEPGIGGLKIVVRVRNFDLLMSLVLGAMTTTSTTSMLMVTTLRSSAIIRLHFSHLSRQIIDGHGSRLLLGTTRLGQLRHGGSNRSSGRPGGFGDRGLG